ncbi:MAG: Ig domain protein [Clostridia bacterium]|nr:Ig domain protein [Clostridia bacterium]
MNKKLIALVLAFALVFSSFTAAFADTAIPADAQATKDLGMLVGSGSGVTIEYLNENPTRLQTAIMFLRLKGLEQTALAYTGTTNFADADQVVWAGGKNIMAYLNNNPQLGWGGIGNNKFNPNAAVDAASYYKVMLETLGYKQGTDFEWTGIMAFAATKGLVKVANASNYTVNDLATATIEALKATVKAGNETLVAQLVKAGVISEAAAVAAGIYVAAPTVLAVESVKASNLKETIVTFNKEVDEDTAEDASNYLLDDEKIAGTVALNADKKSVTITWTTNLDNQTEYDLTISDIMDAADAELAEVTVTFLANDVTLPVAHEITLVGPNKFEIHFSEPLAVEGDVTVADADFDYEVADITVDGDVVTVELSDDELAEGNYSVEISNFADFAGLKGLKKIITLAYEKDTTAPVATVTEATQTKVVVEFDKPVYNGTSADAQPLTADFFYHTYTSYKPVYVDVADNNKEFTLYFTEAAAEAAGSGDLVDVTDRPLSEGNVKFVVVADADDNITDEWGNEVENNMTFTVSIAADTTAPTVTKVEVEDQKTILVYFSEDVTAAEGDFTVVDEDGEDVEITSFGYEVTSDDEYVATLGFDTLEGEYSVTVEDVVDKALESNEISKVTKKFVVADETAPDLSKVTIVGVDGADADEADYIYVSFPEDMATSGAYSVLDKDNYQIKVGSVYADLKTADKIATFNGNDMIKITLDDSTKYTVAASSTDSNVELVIGRVADALGNKTTTFNVAKLVAEEVSPIITSVKTLAEKSIEITIKGELKAVNKSFITVAHGTNDAVPVYAIKSVTVEDGETVIVAVLPATEKLTDSADKAITVSVLDKKFVTILGTEMDAFTFAAAGVEDGFAPSVVKDGIEVSATNKVFTITFDENLNTALAALYSQDLTVKNADGDVLVAGVDYKTEVLGKVITVTIIDADAETGNYKVASNATIQYIRDVEGNKANAFTTVETIEDLVK